MCTINGSFSLLSSFRLPQKAKFENSYQKLDLSHSVSMMKKLHFDVPLSVNDEKASL